MGMGDVSRREGGRTHLGRGFVSGVIFGLKKTAAPGVDDMTWTEYAENLEANLADRF
jgi:hypothetical protein